MEIHSDMIRWKLILFSDLLDGYKKIKNNKKKGIDLFLLSYFTAS